MKPPSLPSPASRGEGIAFLAIIIIASLAPLAFAIDRTVGVVSRVEAEGGAVHEGRLHYEKTGVKVETSRGTVTLPWKKVVSLDEVDAAAPTPEMLAKDRLDYEARARDVKPDDAAGWNKLGAWAKRRGLAAEAKAAFEKTIAIAPDDKEARAGLGQVKDGDAWKDAAEVVRAKRAAAGKNDKALIEVARLAQSAGLDEEAIDAVRPLVLAETGDPFRADVIALLKPITSRRRPRTVLKFPSKGAWNVSSDPTHHHEKKAYALFALDFIGVDEQGRDHTGDGKKVEDWCGWGRPILACADGVVAEVREGHPDNPINKIGTEHNGVSITHESGEQTWYLHCMKGSITVKVGDKVKAGDVLGKVGNSGASGVPHLHFTLVERGISVPWSMDGYRILSEDGSVAIVKRGRPTEGLRVSAE